MRKYIFIGNPGVGKSTILNGLLGRAFFRSGITRGAGLTQALQTIEFNGALYVDTPGLHDPASRRRAAEEIKRGLMLEGEYKIFFVVTLESGRVRTVDQALIQIVLEALRDTNVGGKYSIIVSKVSTRVWDGLEREPTEFRALLFPDGVPATPFLWPFHYDAALHDEDDVVHTLPSNLKQFILQDTPLVTINPGLVRNLDVDRMEAVTQAIEAMREMITGNREMLEAAIAAIQTQMEELHRQLEEERRRHSGIFGIPLIGSVFRGAADMFGMR